VLDGLHGVRERGTKRQIIGDTHLGGVEECLGLLEMVVASVVKGVGHA
jgi:hypothetical protein